MVACGNNVGFEREVRKFKQSVPGISKVLKKFARIGKVWTFQAFLLEAVRFWKVAPAYENMMMCLRLHTERVGGSTGHDALAQ